MQRIPSGSTMVFWIGSKKGAGQEYLLKIRLKVQKKKKRYGRIWRLKVGNRSLDETAISCVGGGSVVGKIPKGLPVFSLPRIDFKVMLTLFPMAAIISRLGFMEAISIAKAMAGKTGQRLDPHQELIGQGLPSHIVPS